MKNSILPAYTKARANKLASIKHSDIKFPVPVKVYWLNSFSNEGKSIYISKQMHKHTFFEVHFIINGTAKYKLDDGALCILGSKQGVVLVPGQDHQVLSHSEDILRFSLAFLPETGTGLYTELMKKKAHIFNLTDKLLSYLNSALNEADVQTFVSQILVQNRVSDILCTLIQILQAEHSEPSIQTSETSDSIAISKAKQYIKDNSNKMLGCKEVAEHCHFNEKYLGRKFKEKTGTTILEYIHREKTKQAEILLADKSLSLKAVSEHLGFANEYYFNSFFKRCNGVTPGQYRKMIIT